MGGRDVGRRLLAGLVSMTLLASCGAGASPAPAPFGPVSVVTGTSRCPGLDFAWTTDADGTKHVRDDYHANRCTVTTDDPRVSGNRSSTWNMDLWGRLGVNHELVQWGTQRLENDGGAWEGRATGVAYYPSSPGDIIAHWYRGTGGYAGLSYFELWTGFEPWKIQGQIFPGDPPPPYAEEAMGTERPVDGGPVADEAVAKVTGTQACPDVNPNWTTDPDGTMHLRDYALECTDTTDDPRVSGTHTASTNMDVWGTLEQGAGVQWASVRIENAGGAWEGRAMGVASLPERGDTIVIWYRGTGDYAGLGYFELITGSFPTYKIQGQIFPGDPPMP